MEAAGRYPVKNGKRNRERKIHAHTVKDKFDQAFSFLILVFFSSMNASNGLCAPYLMPQPLCIGMNCGNQQLWRLWFVERGRLTRDQRSLKRVFFSSRCKNASAEKLSALEFQLIFMFVAPSFLPTLPTPPKKALLKKIPNNITLIDFRFSSSQAVHLI